MSWIKMRVNLATDPDVLLISELTGKDVFGVVGRLHTLWSWADTHSLDGNALRVTEARLDGMVDCKDFAAAMRKVGWLSGRDSALDFPRFDRHNGQTAKSRALGQARTDRHRGKARSSGRDDGDVTHDALPEERRSEEKIDDTLTLGAARVGGSREIPDWPTVKKLADKLLLPEWRARAWFDEMEITGWTYKNVPVRKWQPFLSKVKTWWEADGRPSQPQSKSNAGNSRTGSARNRGTENDGTAAEFAAG